MVEVYPIRCDRAEMPPTCTTVSAIRIWPRVGVHNTWVMLNTFVRVSLTSRVLLDLDHRYTLSFGQSQHCSWRCENSNQTQHRSKPVSQDSRAPTHSSNQLLIPCYDLVPRLPKCRWILHVHMQETMSHTLLMIKLVVCHNPTLPAYEP